MSNEQNRVVMDGMEPSPPMPPVEAWKMYWVLRFAGAPAESLRIEKVEEQS